MNSMMALLRPKFGINWFAQLGETGYTNLYKFTPYNISAVDCWILLKFGMLVHYWYPKARSSWNPPTLKSKMADSPQIFNL